METPKRLFEVWRIVNGIVQKRRTLSHTAHEAVCSTWLTKDVVFSHKKDPTTSVFMVDGLWEVKATVQGV